MGRCVLTTVFGLFAWLALLSPAMAGGQECSEGEYRRAVRVDRGWKRAAARAIPKMIAALGDENFCLASRARQRVIGSGDRAAGPLLGALGKGSCDEFGGVSPAAGVTADMMCQGRFPAQRKAVEDGLLERLRGADECAAAAALAVVRGIASTRLENCPQRVGLQAFLVASLGPLRALLNGSSTVQKGRALDALGSLGHLAGPLVEEMTLLADQPELVEAACSALGALGPIAGAAVPGLTSALGRARGTHRAKIAAALGKIGPTARPAREGLLSLIPDLRSEAVTFDGRYALQEVLTALERIGGSGGGPALQAALRDERLGYSLRRLAAAALVATGDASLSVFDGVLLELIRRKSGLQEEHTYHPQISAVSGEVNNAFLICRLEAGLEAFGDDRFRDASGDRARQLAHCLSDRLCGPSEETYRWAVGFCCQEAYGDETPPFCTP